MRNRLRRRQSMSEINVVPYVDVMLVLLVIFMITAPLLTQGVEVNLPSTKAKSIAAKEKPPIIVSVDKMGLYYLNISKTPDAPVEPKQLQLRIAAELVRDKTREVLVRGDKEVSYDRIISAMVSIQQAGAETVGLVTDPNSERA